MSLRSPPPGFPKWEETKPMENGDWWGVVAAVITSILVVLSRH
jgi:hypothetical protein